MEISIITSKQFRKAAKLIGPALAKKATIKGANVSGSMVRKNLHGDVLSQLVDAPRAPFQIKAKAASTHQAKGAAYTIRMASAIPISRVKARARRFTPLRRGAKVGILEIKGVGGKVHRFAAARRFGGGSRAFQLLEAGPLPSRAVGGVKISKRTLEKDRRFRKLVEAAQREGIDAAADAIMAALS